MKLDYNIKKKITERFLKKKKNTGIFNIIPEKITYDLLNGVHNVNITTRGKFTIAETKYSMNGYEHHFFGLAVKNPCDKINPNYGIRVAVENSLNELIAKFIFCQRE